MRLSFPSLLVRFLTFVNISEASSTLLKRLKLSFLITTKIMASKKTDYAVKYCFVTYRNRPFLFSVHFFILPKLPIGLSFPRLVHFVLFRPPMCTGTKRYCDTRWCVLIQTSKAILSITGECMCKCRHLKLGYLDLEDV